MKQKLVFFGSPEFSLDFLSALLPEYDVVLVVTAPDRPNAHAADRQSAVKQFAAEQGLTVLAPGKFDMSTVERITSFDAALAVVVAYGKILPAELINSFPRGMINVHGSILPKYRGASPIEAAILAGEKQTGPTIMLIEPSLDAGPILAQTSFELTGLDQAQAYQKMAAAGCPLLLQTLDGYLGGHLKPQPQDSSEATYTTKINKADGHLDTSRPAQVLALQVLAFRAWPTSYFEYDGKPITVLEAAASKDYHQPAGSWFCFGGKLFLACHDSSLQVKKLKLAGKSVSTGQDFINSHSEINRI